MVEITTKTQSKAKMKTEEKQEGKESWILPSHPSLRMTLSKETVLTGHYD